MKALKLTPTLIGKVVIIIPLLCIVVITFVDVFARYVFNSPILGSAELIKYFMALTIFLSLPVVTFKREHISVSLLDGIRNKLAQKTKVVLVGTLTTLALLMLSYILYKQGYNYDTSGATTLFIGLPLDLLCYAMSLFSLLAAVSVPLRVSGLLKINTDTEEPES